MRKFQPWNGKCGWALKYDILNSLTETIVPLTSIHIHITHEKIMITYIIIIVWLDLQQQLSNCFNRKSNYPSKFWKNESFSVTLTYHQLFLPQLPCKLFIPLRVLLYSRPLGKPTLNMGILRKPLYRFGLHLLCALYKPFGWYTISKLTNAMKNN